MTTESHAWECGEPLCRLLGEPAGHCVRPHRTDSRSGGRGYRRDSTDRPSRGLPDDATRRHGV